MYQHFDLNISQLQTLRSVLGLSSFDVNTVSYISSHIFRVRIIYIQGNAGQTPPPFTFLAPPGGEGGGGLNVRLPLWYLKYQYIVQDIGKYVALRPRYKTPARFY